LNQKKMIERKVEVTSVYENMEKIKTPIILNVGGSRSSKSYSIAQMIIKKITEEENKTIGICRKTFPALRMTVYDLMIRLLKDYGLYNRGKHNKTEHSFEYGSNKIWFFSIEDVERIKSSEFNYIWMEECSEFSYNEFIILKLRLSGQVLKGETNQMFLSCNPVNINSWIAEKLTKRMTF